MNATQQIDAATLLWSQLNKVEPKPHWRSQIITADALQRKTFERAKWIVPDLIPEGLTLLCGRPKVGKSWAALDIGLAVATGGTVFGRLAATGEVLYAALEDNQARLQRRIEKLLPDNAVWPAGLSLTTDWERLNQGGGVHIVEWVQERAPNARLVILDTLAGVKPISTKEGYTADYASLEALHKVANELRVGVLVLHHTRKAEAEDPLDTISGTLGLAGCADTALVLAGTAQGMSLYVRGRDIEQAEHAVNFDKASCRWSITGTAAEVRMSKTRKTIASVLLDAPNPLGPKAIAIETGLAVDVVRQRLPKMVEALEVRQVARGLYTHPENQEALNAAPLL